jgi:hypothetical protein
LSFRGALALLKEPAEPAPAADGDALAILEEKARQTHKCLAAVEQMTHRISQAEPGTLLSLVTTSNDLFAAAVAAGKEINAEFERLWNGPALSLADCVRVERIAFSFFNRWSASYIRHQWQLGMWLAEIGTANTDAARKLRGSLKGADLRRCRRLAQMDAGELDNRINEIVDAGGELTLADVLRYSYGGHGG